MDWRRFTEVIRTGTPDPWWYCMHHGGGKGSAPDYTGAAQQQGAISQNLATQNTWANRPNQVGPGGSTSWQAGSTIDPSTGKPVTNWTQNTTLAPEQQAAFDAQSAMQAGRSQTGAGMLDQVKTSMGTPFDWSGLPQMPGSIADAQKQSYQTMESALQPQRDRQSAALRTQLANSGLPMDSQAYKNAQTDLSQQNALTDKGVMAQAMQQGINDTQAQQQLRQEAIAGQEQQRTMPLTEMNALLTGQNVSMPTMPSFAPATSGQAPDLLGAAAQQGQYQLGQNNDIGSLIGAGAGLAGAAMIGGSVF
jgi:hypothetical protein